MELLFRVQLTLANGVFIGKKAYLRDKRGGVLPENCVGSCGKLLATLTRFQNQSLRFFSYPFALNRLYFTQKLFQTKPAPKPHVRFCASHTYKTHIQEYPPPLSLTSPNPVTRRFCFAKLCLSGAIQ